MVFIILSNVQPNLTRIVQNETELTHISCYKRIKNIRNFEKYYAYFASFNVNIP